jgi:hypothetical protein
MKHDDEALRAALHVEPPAALDALVRERALDVLIARRALTNDGASPSAPAQQVPLAERWVYASGLAVYSGQALYGLVRLLARAMGI